jgi:thiol-disulfide isomerase/thioredoxin
MAKRELKLVPSEPDESAEMKSEDIDATFVPELRGEVAVVEVDEEAVLLNEETSALHWMDQLGTIVVKCFDGEATLDELGADIAEAFGADRQVVRDDLITTARRLGGAGLLEGVAEDPPPQHAQPEGLEVGTEVPSFSLPDLEDETVAFEDLRGGRLLMINWSPHCGFCARIAPDLAELRPELEERGVRMVLLTIGEPDDNRKLMEEHGLSTLALLQGTDTWEPFQGLGTPCAYLIDEKGLTASELSLGALDVPKLARSLAGRPEEEPDQGS